jgi:phosphoribosylformylglycinamidine synthase
VNRFAVDVVVTLRPVINDPQGLSVKAGLWSLGFDEVRSARVGKLIELLVDAPDEAAARTRVIEMCEKLLRNPVIEDYRIDALRPAGERDAAGAGASAGAGAMSGGAGGATGG